MRPNTVLEPTAAPLLASSLRSYRGTGRSTVATAQACAACLPEPRRGRVRSTVSAAGRGLAGIG
jgi:hypothetical protein